MNRSQQLYFGLYHFVYISSLQQSAQMEEEYQDDWLDEPQPVNSASLFQKTIVNFTNEVIENNLNRKMERPILNLEFQNQELELDQGDYLEQETHTSATKESKQSSKFEALFNPLEDDDNQTWAKKNCKKVGRPLTCPSCFTQIAFNYISEQQAEITTYRSSEVFSVQVKQTKIIRQVNTSEKMVWSGVNGEQAERELKEREEDFNIKIIAQCICGHTVGYFDVNKESYILTDVI